MKALKISLLCLFLALLSLPAAVANGIGDNPNDQLKKKVVKMIQKVDLSGLETPEAEAFVAFVLNDKNEIVVMSVDTESEFADQLIKSKLNYHEIDIEGVRKNTTYTIKMKFVREI